MSEPLETLTAYAIVADVEALNRARKFDVGNNPSSEDVQFYLEVIAGEINTVLAQKGYELPIPSTVSNARQWLRGLNAKGAHMMAEEASPSSPGAERARKDYEEALALLRESEFLLDIPQAHEQARPRGPVGSPAFFKREMVFGPSRL